jgi:hypothetical protein
MARPWLVLLSIPGSEWADVNGRSNERTEWDERRGKQEVVPLRHTSRESARRTASLNPGPETLAGKKPAFDQACGALPLNVLPDVHDLCQQTRWELPSLAVGLMT